MSTRPMAATQEYFGRLCDAAFQKLAGSEILLVHMCAESTDFVRFNHAKVRQAGSVEHATLSLRLVAGSKHAQTTVTISGDDATDTRRVDEAVANLRELLPSTPDDPFLMFNTDVTSSEKRDDASLPTPDEMLGAVQDGAAGKDLVGIWASGAIVRGFANSLGQRNWYATANFNFDYSIYAQTDKAVKGAYAGKQWNPAELKNELAGSIERAEVLNKTPKTIAPGTYRVFLTPSALAEVFSLLSWQGFSAEEQQAKRSPLMRAVNGKASLSPSVHVRENVAAGVDANFDAQGFLLPESTTLFDHGKYASPLVSPRSAKQFGLARNCGAREAPSSLEMLGGTLPQDEVLQALGTGIYVSNLWYLNYSDRNACRLTGMTRFATLWVEDGTPVAPLNVMRFDESLYNMLGENLMALTKERQLLLDPATYDRRSTESALLPGALVDNMPFTL